ncbi:methyl-accepting chemotaxis protein [Candidatus Parcubacteria bacterium]|nr:methyl-accepting chemotaxis protein [Candidatus Parcubacteria bacterium]
MKVAETKIYLKFISWFVAVSLLPIALLFLIIYTFSPDSSVLLDPELQKIILVSVFISIALIFILSLAATRHLSRLITKPIQGSMGELSKVVDELFKSIQDLSDVSQNNSELSQFLIHSSQAQQKGLKTGTKVVSEMVQSLDQIARKTKVSARNTKKIADLANEGGVKSNVALDSLVVVKQLSTENQKLSQALDAYAFKVKDIAKRVGILAETAKFLSLNVSIEANKTSFSENFSSLISQIRELNVTSEQAANSIQGLAGDMQRQIEQSKQSSIHEWQQTNKTIKVIGQTINFLSGIVGNVSNVSKSTQVISQEAEETHREADNINSMIGGLNKEAKSLVKYIDDITKTIYKQLTVTKSLHKSSAALNKVTDTLNDLVGKK